MLAILYKHLLFMSVVGGILYLILKFFSRITLKYFSAAWHYYSYLLISTFFVIPYYALLQRFNLYLNIQIGKLFSVSKTMLNSSIGSEFTANPQTVLIPSTVNYDTETINVLSKKISTCFYYEKLTYFFILGTLMFLVIAAIKYYRLSRRMFRACQITYNKEILDTFSKCKQELGIKRKISVYICDYPIPPFITGILRPRIVLPDIKLSLEELRYVFIHELTHLKNHDEWLKILLFFINAVHWYNPIIYMVRRDINCFCEVFCDENITKSMNKQERRGYCELILNLILHVVEPNVKIFSAFSGERKYLERRINMIMKTRKNKKWVSILAIAVTLVLALSGTTITNASNDADNNSKRVLIKNVVVEGIGGTAPIDEGKDIFLDSYYELTDLRDASAVETDEQNATSEGIGGTGPIDGGKDIFLDSYYEITNSRDAGAVETDKQNATSEGIGGTGPIDGGKDIFLDSYYEITDSRDAGAVETDEQNATAEGIGGTGPIDGGKDVFLNSYYESSAETEVLSEGKIGILAQYNIDWDLESYERAYGVSQLSMSKGNKIDYKIDWSPEPGVIRVGLYNRNTGEYYWDVSSTEPPLQGTIIVPEDGLYSFAIGNSTDTTVNATGYFIY